VSEGVALIKCGKSKFSLPVIDAERYPATPKNAEAKSFAIATDILKEGVAATLKTVSADETKPMLLGVHLREFDEVLEGEDDPTHFLAFVSTDGRRGSFFRTVVPPLASLNITVPTRTLKEVEHINQAETEVHLASNHISFNSRALTIISPLIGQAYPPVRSMLLNLRKQKLSGSVKCDRKELIASLKRVNSLSEGDIYVQSVDISIEDDEMKFVSSIGGVGGVEESLPCHVGSGKFRSLFNPKYLLCILDTTKAKHVKLEAYDGAQRCVFISPCDGTDHETFLMAKAVVGKPVEEEDDDDN
jgi:DNA polymerase III subunit beta